MNLASLGLLTGSCVGALKVPLEVIDNTGFFQSRAAETFRGGNWAVPMHAGVLFIRIIRSEVWLVWVTLKSSFYYPTPVPFKLEKRRKEWIVCFFKNCNSLNSCLLECTPVAVSFHGGKMTKNIIKMLITSRNTPAAEYTSSLSICMLNMLRRLIVLPKNG